MDLVGIGVGVGTEQTQRGGVPGQVEQHPTFDLGEVNGGQDPAGRGDDGAAKINPFGRLAVQVLKVEPSAAGPPARGGTEVLQFIRHPA